MNNEEKAIFIADQCKPCTPDFYSGIKQGVLLALNTDESIEAKTDRNLAVIGDFMEYLKGHHEIEIPEAVYVGYFEQE